MKSMVVRLIALSVLVLGLFPASLGAAQDTAALTGTDWTLVSMDSEPVVDGSSITLTFDEMGSVSGNGGCNGYGGSYSVDGDNISISEVISTLMACADDAVTQQESAYFEALQNAASYTVDGHTLTIVTEDGGELVFSAGAELVGTVWMLVSMGGEPVVEGSDVSLVFDGDGMVSGNGGCNGYRSAYVLDESSLSIDSVFTTLMACGNAVTRQEQAYYELLRDAASYSISGDVLTIVTEAGDELVFNAAPSLVGSNWALVSMSGQALVDDSAISLTFGEDGSASGNGGCNMYRSSYTVDGDRLTFGPVVSTRMACADDAATQQEQDYFRALENATGIRFDGDQLVIASPSGALVFTPASATDVA